MVKYKTMKEIWEDETLDLEEAHQITMQFLEQKGMTMEDYMATEEGQELLKMSEEARFTQT